MGGSRKASLTRRPASEGARKSDATRSPEPSSGLDPAVEAQAVIFCLRWTPTSTGPTGVDAAREPRADDLLPRRKLGCGVEVVDGIESFPAALAASKPRMSRSILIVPRTRERPLSLPRNFWYRGCWYGMVGRPNERP